MTIAEQIIGIIITAFRRRLGVDQFEYQQLFFERLAGFAAPVVALLGLCLAIIAAVKMDSLVAAMAGVAWVVLICVAYYIGKQSLQSCRRLIDNNPSMISSSALLESAALIGIIFLGGTVVSAFYMAIKLSSLTPILIGIAAAGAVMYYISFMLNPELISTFVKENATAGDDALSIMVIFYKCSVKVASIVFGATLIVGSALLAETIYRLLSGEWMEILSSGFTSMAGMVVVFGGLMYPMLIAISFSFFYLLTDICKAILTLHDRQEGGRPATQPIRPKPAQDERAAVVISASTATAVGIGVVVAVLVLVGAIEAKRYYGEYRAEAEAQRLEAEQERAEEAAQKAEQAAIATAAASQAAALEAFAKNARQYIGRPSLDLVAFQEVNAKLIEIFARDLPTFESFFSNSDTVTEVDGLLLASGCRAENCTQNRGLAVVDLKAGKVYAAIVQSDMVTYFGLTEDEELSLPAAVKKWALAR